MVKDGDHVRDVHEIVVVSNTFTGVSTSTSSGIKVTVVFDEKKGHDLSMGGAVGFATGVAIGNVIGADQMSLPTLSNSSIVVSPSSNSTYGHMRDPSSSSFLHDRRLSRPPGSRDSRRWSVGWLWHDVGLPTPASSRTIERTWPFLLLEVVKRLSTCTINSPSQCQFPLLILLNRLEEFPSSTHRLRLRRVFPPLRPVRKSSSTIRLSVPRRRRLRLRRRSPEKERQRWILVLVLVSVSV